MAPDGTVTFIPEKDFVGQAKGVIVKRYDTKGTPILAAYTPLVTPITSYVYVDENPLLPPVDGIKDPENIPGYRLVDTKKLPNGNVIYVYEKVKSLTSSELEKKVPGENTPKSQGKTNEKLGQRLANTGESETNTGLAGMGMAMLGGLLAAAKRRKNNNN